MTITWTAEMKAELLLADTLTKRQSFCERYGVSMATARRRRKGFLAAINGDHKGTDLAKFLSKGRTLQELLAHGIDPDDISVEGFDLFQTRNHFQEPIWLLLPQVKTTEIQPKVWTYKWAVDEDGTPQPYLMIQMPGVPWRKIKIVPIADVHYGSKSHMYKKFREYVNWIAQEENVFAIILGDLFENSLGDSNKGISILEQEVRPRTQLDQMQEILSPIAHKILWAIPGNHEDRSRTRDYDPLERLCENLKIPYSYEPIFADVLWEGYVFSYHCQHGRSASQTKGGKMNAAARPQESQEHVMFTISAHVHDGDVSRNTRICRDRVNFRLDFRKQYVIVCPSFYAYFGSYASKAGYKPGSYGTINTELYPNGDFHAQA